MNLVRHRSVVTTGVTIRKILFFLIALTIVGVKLVQTTRFHGVVDLSNFTYGCIIIILSGIIIAFSPAVRIGRLLAFFVLAGILSLLAANIGISDPSYQRFAFFVLMLVVLSPVVVSDTLSELRLMMWRLLMGGLRLIIIVSFIMYIPWEVSRTSQFVFHGCVNHGMQLGIIGAIVMLDGFWHLICRHETSRIRAMAFGVMTAMAIVVTVATGSRAALLATMIGILPLLWSVRMNKMKMAWIVVIILVLIGVSALGSFRNFDGIKTKTELSAQYGSLTFSRNYLWKARLDEFAERPVFGIGFSKTTIRDLPEDYKDTLFDSCSTLEPGSSWMNVLASTGIIGFAFMFWFNVKLLRKTVNTRVGDRRNLLFFSLLLALLIHGFFEGWVLYAGSTTFMIYWLLSSRIMELQEPENSFAGNIQ